MDIGKVTGVACHQDSLLFDDNRSDAEIIRTDSTMGSP